MKRIAFAAVLLLAATALAGVLRPEGAEAVDPAPATDSVSVTGTGVVVAVPDQAQVSAGVESRAQTASAALAANAAAMRKVLDALRDRGGSDVTTQTVSLQTAFDDQGQPNGFVATNVASATTDLDAAGALIDAAVDTGANTIYGPSLERSDAEKLYRDALEKAVADAKGRATVLAEAAGRTLGRVTAMTESGSAELPMLAKDAAAARESTPIVSGAQETTATVSVTYELK
jgi:uncharacterized protein